MSELHIRLTDLADTARLGAVIAPLLVAGDTLLLNGDLGAGKTTLARAIGEALKADPPLASPTFVLASEHSGRLPITHIDAYRLDVASDPIALGLIEPRSALGVTIVEWPERLAWDPGDSALRIELNVMGEGREAMLETTAAERIAALAAAATAAGLGVRRDG